MEIDRRIYFIMDKMKQFSKKKPEFICGEFPPKWNPPLKEQVVKQYEKENGILLPQDYRRFIITVADGGTQPFYGLYPLMGKLPSYEKRAAVYKKFPYTIRTPLNIAKLSEEAYHALFETQEADAGYILLCQEGCGMRSILIVNTEDKETYGTVWFYDLCNDAGIYPLVHPITHQTMSFLDWLEYYVDKTLELEDSDFFSYGELAGRIDEVN